MGKIAISTILHQANEALSSYSDTPTLDAEIIMSHVLKRSREHLFSHPEQTITAEQLEQINALIAKRAQGIPIAYLTNEKGFFNLNFFINEDVLIPRPETEILVETALSHLQSMTEDHRIRVIDVGTGSGCILLSLAHTLKKRSNFEFLGLDVSPRALKVARKNRDQYNLDEKVHFESSDLLTSIKADVDGKDVIVANLPYISPEEKVSASVQYEPQVALYADDKGLALYKKLLTQMHNLNVSAFFFEIGEVQAEGIIQIIGEVYPDVKVEIIKDLAGKDRVVWGEMEN